MGIRNVMAVTGDAHTVGDYPDATEVFDVDSIGLTNMVARLNRGIDIGRQSIGRPTEFHIGVLVNPSADDLEAEIRRFEYKVEAGAEFAFTRPVFDVGRFERFLARVQAARIPIIAGLWPFDSALHAEFMANEVPGTHVPIELLERMRRAPNPDAAAAEGAAIAREIGRVLRGAVQGVHLAAPSREIDAVVAVLEGLV
jgi:homocysteine S-methyltransferase